VEDVWLPLFAPDPGRAAAGEAAERAAARAAEEAVELPAPFTRPPASGARFEDRVALTGIGMSDVGRRLMRTGASLAAQACLAAIEDAGLAVEDIDGLATYPGPAGGGFSEGGVTAVVEALGLRPTWHAGGMETPGQTGSVVNAMLAVAAGLCRHVLCFRTVTEATHTYQVRAGLVPPPGPGRLEGDLTTWRVPFGAPSAANWIAMAASRYRHLFGLERETLGWIALNARANAVRNDRAVYREPLTMDDYLTARMVTTPFGLYDCDVPCDGSVAVVVSSREAAADCRHPAVHVAAVGTGMSERQSWDQGTVTHEPNVFGPASHLWTRTDLTPADVDVAELYDGFTFNCLTWLEALGFCPVGEAAGFLDGGNRIALGGELPLNTHGGQLSAGRTHGYGFLHEAIVQLRGDGGVRQVAGAEVAVVATGGGTPGGCLLLTRP
jgi:acetyl-CoA acetyltransferase